MLVAARTYASGASARGRSSWEPAGRVVDALDAAFASVRWATANKVLADTFVVYTDNETWAGSVHPHQALRGYRDWSGIDARLVVVGLTATDFTIADPADPGMLDISGFDSALPTLLTDFSARAI